MSKKVYNKLVRDRIPEILEAEGKAVKTHILNKEDYLQELIKKFGEDYAKFKRDQNIEKLADLQEVILALADALNIAPSDLAKTLSKKALEKGAFKRRIFVESVEG